MIFELVQPFKHSPQYTYFKCINTHNTNARNNAWDLWEMLSQSFMRNCPCIVNFDGFENCVEIRNNPAPFLKMKTE